MAQTSLWKRDVTLMPSLPICTIASIRMKKWHSPQPFIMTANVLNDLWKFLFKTDCKFQFVIKWFPYIMLLTIAVFTLLERNCSATHCVKYKISPKFLVRKCIVSTEFRAIITKFTHQKVRWNYRILYSIIEIALWYRCSPVNLLHIFETPFLKNTSGYLLFIL